MILFQRHEWGAKWGRGHSKPGPRPWVVIHHSQNPDVPCGRPHQDEAALVATVEDNHSRPAAEGGRGWDGIGYNFVVFQSGHVFEGRGWDRTGAHAKGRNSTSVGICLFIDGEQHTPTKAAIHAIRELIQQGVATGRIAPDYEIVGHRDVWATDCPGDAVYHVLDLLRP